ncbi:alpha-amylase [Pseudonocardia sp. EV170527-09]|uniref:alpha-amylase family glycosyl hydrolase n=1 Tax=Pseudonocardia sp. EV170527-09 TaxID=2603411 RepID=UPI0011F31651|nr:alpha-amylase family glycosyl hydrolase [Pseudonocardia sp. EV170527-09]KAA1027032.1 alpha-amylase [Pseudonocardia sp. EV170527-09]
MDWVRHAIWWHVYPLGFTGAHPDRGDGADHSLRRIIGWLDHAVALGANGLLLGPVFASATHGYDTTDHLRIDPRLGSGADFDALVAEAKGRGLRILLDGVFNHVGPEHPRLLAARAHPGGPDDAWFRHTDDGEIAVFEGHPGLHTLDHDNPAVRDHVVDVLCHWLDRGADGWRLDAAYTVPDDFWADVLPRVRARHPGAWFLGEVIHGEHDAVTAATTIDALTQYELWKAVWSSLNDGNPHELAWALQRHDRFVAAAVPNTFLGNHDVTRLASQLHDRRHIELAVAVLCTVGGTPSVYAGDELGLTGVKEERAGGDDAVRPEFPADGSFPDGADPHVLAVHQELIGLRRRHPWLYDARTEVQEATDDRLVYLSHGDGGALRVTLDYAAGTWDVQDA